MKPELKKRCLVVDDDRVTRKLLAELIHNLGFDVDTAYDGQEALDKCKNDPPDVVLLDLYMPEMDGMEFLKTVRKLELSIESKEKRLKVIVCSSEDGNLQVGKTIVAGADGYIVKPFCREKVRSEFINNGIL